MTRNNTILKTKFFVPQPTADFVKRKLLLSKFDLLKNRPLMLISASSGYGKSTLIGDFFRNQSENSVWLSLSKKENEFSEFLRYFIFSIKGKIENFGEEALELTTASAQPSIDEFAEIIINDLAELRSHLYMAIDDYHLINNKEIHAFIEKLFEYPQPCFRLIIITRFDPELPLSIWRTKNKLVEIRSSDLKFDSKEISRFYKNLNFINTNKDILFHIEKVTEGWVSGLRMLVISANNTEELQQNLDNFNFKNSGVIRDLLNSVLKSQHQIIRNSLFKLSILTEFDAGLYAELCLNEADKKNKEPLFNAFISEFIRNNMFIIPLDNNQTWYRFHHLFVEKLNELMLLEFDSDSVNELRLKVADYYNKNNNSEEAIRFYLQANQVTKALNVFTKYRLQLIAENRFVYLEKIVNFFPQEFRDTNGILLVTKGWLLIQKGNIPEMAISLEPLEQFVIKEDHSKELRDLLLGEIHAMQCFDRFHGNIDVQKCLEHSKKAIGLLKNQNPYAYGVAWVFYGAALHHMGQGVKARKDLYKQLEICSSDLLRGQILIMICHLDWFDSNLTAMEKTAKHLIELGTESGIKYFIVSGNVLSGIPYYCQNRDETALVFLEKAYELRHFSLQFQSFPAGMALADIYLKTGKKAEADAILRYFEKTALEQSGKLFIKITKAATAELALRYENDLFGLNWAEENDYKDFLPIAPLYSPEIVQASILVLDSKLTSQKLAQEVINNTILYFENRNDLNVQLRAFIIQALLSYKDGDTDKAFEFLQKSLDISSIGKYIRPFLNLGNSMKILLVEYKKTVKNDKHVDEILQSFYLKKKAIINFGLSQREREILKLAETMTNKEVGNQLFISEKTVKSHITNINKKLNTGSKLDAVDKAKDLGLI